MSTIDIPIATRSVLELFSSGIERRQLHARWEDGTVIALPVERWLGLPDGADQLALARARGPVLDIGCGPGRHLLALAQRGVPALGLDVSAAAVRLARGRGARVLRQSVFQPVPRAGTWSTALLLDGNIGIGGAPDALLARLRQLLRPDGEVLVELAPPGVGVTRERLRLELDGELSQPFDWAYVGVDAIVAIAFATGFTVAEQWRCERRRFARLAASA